MFIAKIKNFILITFAEFNKININYKVYLSSTTHKML